VKVKFLAPLLVLLVPCLLAAPERSDAQFARPPAPPPANSREAAPIDLTGYWVGIVTEDWRTRMMIPDKGDYGGIGLNAAARAVANTWDPAQHETGDNACKAFGAPAIMRIPTRLHITWVDDNTLRVETDAGSQTRVFNFNKPPRQGTAPSWQGYSLAMWEGFDPRGFAWGATTSDSGGTVKPGYLTVKTSQLRPGYLRKNGVPYGSQATVEEYFESFKEPNGDVWLIVTSVVTDPQYLERPFVTSSQFRKQRDATGWHPTACDAK
jgi:hypothetical protein